MKLTIVGCTGSMSGPKSASSAYLLQAAGSHNGQRARTYNVLFDLGSGAIGALQNHLDPLSLDAVVISHLHADHMVDLIGMQVYRRWNPEANSGQLPIYGPTDTLERTRQVGGDAPTETYGDVFDFRTLHEGVSLDIGPMTITPYRAQHPVDAFGFRVDGPSSSHPGQRARFAYTGDTDLCPTQVEMATDSDLLLAEAAFQAGRDTVRGIHMTGERAGELAAQASADHLVLTHIQPWTDTSVVAAEARHRYDGQITVAQAGATHLI